MDRRYHSLAVEPETHRGDDESSRGGWSDGSSCSSYSDTDSSIAEWEGSVDPTGQLYYVDVRPRSSSQERDGSTANEPQSAPDKNRTASRSTTRRSIRAGKLVRLIRRRDSKRHSRRSYTSYTDAYATDGPATVAAAGTVTDVENEIGSARADVRQIVVRVDPSDRHKFGRRASSLEAMLGITPKPLDDGRIVVAAIAADSAASKQHIMIGDWLRYVDEIQVDARNIDAVLETIAEPRNVRIVVQGAADAEVGARSPAIHPFAIVYVDIETGGESASECDDIVYCYPEPVKDNVLARSRGTFATLCHLLPDAIGQGPEVTAAIVESTPAHVLHRFTRGRLLLILLLDPRNRIHPVEARKIFRRLLCGIEYLFGDLSVAFKRDNKPRLDEHFSKVFADIFDAKSDGLRSPRFEDLLPATKTMSLPREALMQLNDALDELEAADYRDWNQDPLDCQRLFTIIGSAFYHSGHLLASHFTTEDAKDVDLFLRQQGIFRLSCSESLRTLVSWRTVFPTFFRKEFQDSYVLPRGRWFLLVVANSKDVLAVLMEAGGCTSPAEEFQGPDVFYVEEAQETLTHIQNMGISALAEKWLNLNLRPRTVKPDVVSPSKSQRRSDFLGNIGFINMASSKINLANKKSETLSKGRSPSTNQDISEDSQSQGTHSEHSDEPIQGRKERREQNIFDSDESDSDWDDCRPDSEISGYSYNSDLRHLDDTLPTKITSGQENVLFSYMHFDCAEGIFLSELSGNVTQDEQLLANFKRSVLSIHNLFQSTVRFKNMLASNLTRTVINKSLIAIKEHGISFQYSFEEASKKSSSFTYWVVGRLFFVPHPREFYVCYKDSVPQNLVEMAFRLNMNSV